LSSEHRHKATLQHVHIGMVLGSFCPAESVHASYSVSDFVT
jgi:hypothetical protein